MPRIKRNALRNRHDAKKHGPAARIYETYNRPSEQKMKMLTNFNRKSIVATGFLIAMSQTAMAADLDGNYALRGVGSATCANYTTALANDPALAQTFVGWMAGYITARSRVADETFDVLPLISGADVAGLMRVICLQNADTSFESAIDSAIALFEPARITTDSPLLELNHAGRTVAVRQSTLEQVQEALATRGFYSSTVDGAYGPGTQVAISAFQASSNLQDTGLPDADTIVALLLADP